MAGIWNQGGGSEPAPTREELIATLQAVWDNLETAIADLHACPFCNSSVHKDGDISHDEDCSVPDVETTMGRIAE